MAGEDGGSAGGSPEATDPAARADTFISSPVDLPSLSGIKFPSCQRTRAASDSRQQGVKMGRAQGRRAGPSRFLAWVRSSGALSRGQGPWPVGSGGDDPVQMPSVSCCFLRLMPSFPFRCYLFGAFLTPAGQVWCPCATPITELITLGDITWLQGRGLQRWHQKTNFCGLNKPLIPSFWASSPHASPTPIGVLFTGEGTTLERAPSLSPWSVHTVHLCPWLEVLRISPCLTGHRASAQAPG